MAKASPTPSAGLTKRRTDVEYLGQCVLCPYAIFSDQAWGRAPRPWLGKAHNECGAVTV